MTIHRLAKGDPNRSRAGSTRFRTSSAPSGSSARFALIPSALADLPYWFVGAYLVLITTDLIDGPIARSLHQRCELGAHLDSVADATLNA